ncbi:hypothetical protein AOLI_G00244310 [Acnodon oligacanthus]
MEGSSDGDAVLEMKVNSRKLLEALITAASFEPPPLKFTLENRYITLISEDANADRSLHNIFSQLILTRPRDDAQ